MLFDIILGKNIPSGFRRVVMLVSAVTIGLPLDSSAGEKPAYPGTACYELLHDIERISRDIRVYRNSMNHNYKMAHEKRGKGNRTGADGELDYAEKNAKRMDDGYGAYSGAVIMSRHLGCSEEDVRAATKCGVINMREGC